MSNEFLKLFQSNTALSLENKKVLVEKMKEILTFDAVFANKKLVPADLAALLQKYGWFWVSIDADPDKGRRPHAVVVNDVTESTDSADAQVKYYDVADGQVKEVNFTDFIDWVKQGVLIDEHLSYVVIRLKNAPGEGKIGDLGLMDKETRHLVYVDAIKSLIDKYKDDETFLEAGYGYKTDETGAKKLQLIVHFNNRVPEHPELNYNFYSQQFGKQFSLSSLYKLDEDEVFLASCEHKVLPETRVNTTKSDFPVLGGVNVNNNETGGSGTLGAWFRDKETGKAVMLTNQHVAENVDFKLSLLKYEASSGRVGFGPSAFKVKRMGMEQTDDVELDHDMAVVEPIEAKSIPSDLAAKGNKFTWNKTVYRVKGIKEPIVGEKVFKIGASTGFTEGEIKDYFMKRVKDNDPTVVAAKNYVIRFSIENTTGMIAPGDSGSVLISSAKNATTGFRQFVGLNYGRGPATPDVNCMSKQAYALGITYCCERMNIESY